MAAFAGGCPAMAQSLPTGWRAPNAQQAASFRHDAITCANPKQMLAIRADFDGDGRKDRAQFLLNFKTGKVALFAVRAETGRYERLGDADELSRLCNYTLVLERPRVFKALCEGGGACDKRVRARWPAIGLSYAEASYQIFFWNGRRFQNEFLGD